VGAKIAFLTLHVDYILLAGNDLAFLPEIKNCLLHTFEMKDLGDASCILNIKITRDRAARKRSLSQETYITIVLSRFKMNYSSAGMLPYNGRKKLSKEDCPRLSSDKLG